MRWRHMGLAGMIVVSSAFAAGCLSVDDYVYYVEEEQPEPGEPVKPEDPENMPEQGETKKPDGSGGIVPGESGAGEYNPGGVDGTGEYVVSDDVSVEFVTPGRGDVSGGYEVRLRGTELSADGVLEFGSLRSPKLTYVNSKVIRAVVPPGKPGCVDVTWTQGDKTYVVDGGFCYVASVSLSGIVPNTVLADSVTPVVLTGTGFNEGTRVYLNVSGGWVPLTETEVISASEIHGLLPDLPVGRVGVVISNEVSHQMISDALEVLPRISLDGVSPDVIVAGQRTSIAFAGQGFSEKMKLQVGGTPVIVDVKSEHEANGELRMSAVGDYDVFVHEGSLRQARAEKVLHVVKDDGNPAFVSVFPGYGCLAGGENVRLGGINLPTNGYAMFGAKTANVVSRDKGAWSVKVPQGDKVGLVDVKVGKLIIKNGYEYVACPSVSSVSPSHGKTGDKLVLTGTGFDKSLRVYFGPWEAGEISVSDTTRAEVTVPSGTGDVAIRVVHGRSLAETEARFVYDDDVEITGMSPGEAVLTGTTTVTLYGAGFGKDVSLKVDGVDVPFEMLSGNVLSFVAPPHETGNAKISLVCSDGNECASSTLNYYDPTGASTGAFGGPINGQLNVTVRTVGDADPIEGATVFVGSDSKTAMVGTTDENGRVSFYSEKLKDAQIVSACAPEHSCNTMQPINSMNVTLLLEDWHANDSSGSDIDIPDIDIPDDFDFDFDVNPIDMTVPYTPKPSYFKGTVGGFGKVELAANPGYVRAGIVMQSSLGLYEYSHSADDIYIVTEEGGRYFFEARNGEVALALYCGLYNPDTGNFKPKYFGIVRHIMVTDGMEIYNDLTCDIPMNQTQAIKLRDAPLKSGPDIVIASGYVSLGNEGYLGGFMTGYSSSELVVAKNLPAPRGAIEDAKYSFLVGAYTLVEEAEDSVKYRYPATQFYSYDNDLTSDVLEVGPAAPIPVFVTKKTDNVLDTGRVTWKVEYPENVDFYAMTIRLYSAKYTGLLWQFYLPGSATSAEFPSYHKWPDDHTGQIYIQLTAYKSIRDGFDFNLFTTAETRYNYIHSSASANLVIYDPRQSDK